MLISLKSGAVGLNLTAASNVFLVCRVIVQRADGSVIRGGNLLLKLKLLIVYIEQVVRRIARSGADRLDGSN
jgi:hypothetical protein